MRRKPREMSVGYTPQITRKSLSDSRWLCISNSRSGFRYVTSGSELAGRRGCCPADRQYLQQVEVIRCLACQTCLSVPESWQPSRVPTSISFTLCALFSITRIFPWAGAPPQRCRPHHFDSVLEMKAQAQVSWTIWGSYGRLSLISKQLDIT